MDATRHLAHWPVRLLLAVVLALQLLLPREVALGPPWLVPAVQGVLLAPLVLANPVRLERTHPVLRVLALVTAFLVLGANTARLANLVWAIADGVAFAAGDLVLAAVIVLVTNVVGVAVVFWELDRGGPVARDPLHVAVEQDPDLLFPQMGLTGVTAERWRPQLTDYLFVAFTVTTAFSPTDTMPLSRSFKLLFMLAATTAFTTIAVVAARAVNLA